MKFDQAISMVLARVPATRTSWVSAGCNCRVEYDKGRDRIRYICDAGGIRTDYNWYPTQADMLADDWELARPAGMPAVARA